MAGRSESAYQEDQGKSRAYTRWPQNAEEHESLGKLLGELASQSASLVRDEVALAQQEIREKVKIVQAAVIVTIAGAVLFLVSLFALSAALILVLAEYMKAWQSALLVGALMAVIASVITVAGIGRFKRAKLRPTQTLEILEEDKEWLKEMS